MRQSISYIDALERVGVGRTLAGLTWTVAGTLPLNIDVPGSDIDVICSVPDLDKFAWKIWEAFSGNETLHIWQWTDCGRPIVARFSFEGWPFELFGSRDLLENQAAVRHFDVEKRLLQRGGEKFLRAIREVRAGGAKTEPAFGIVLGLAGDPYEALLELYSVEDRKLDAVLAAAGFRSFGESL